MLHSEVSALMIVAEGLQFMHSTIYMYGAVYGLINYKATKTKCRLYWCLIEFIDQRYSQSSSASNLLSGSPPPPLPHSQCQSTVYTDSVLLGGGEGVLSCGV